MWFALAASFALAVPTPEQATAALTEVNARAHDVGFVFLLDSSQSVEPLTEPLRDDIANLVAVLPEGDQVAVLAFHTRPYLAVPRTRITEPKRAALVEKIRRLDLPSGFDRDLGDGLDQLAKLLADPDAAPFQHVVGVSNFCHAPTTLSAWGSGVRGCGPVLNQGIIGKQVKPLVEAKRLSVRWFPIRDKDDVVDVAGADAARREFGGDLVTDAPSTWLQNLQARLVAERPRPLAAADTRDTEVTLTLSAPDAEGNVAVTVGHTGRVLDLKLSNLRFQGLAGTLPTSLELKPSATFGATLAVPDGPFSPVRRRDRVDVAVALTADGELGPAAALSALGLDDERKDLVARTTVSAQRVYGPPPALSALILVSLVGVTGLAAVLVRGRMMPLRLDGSLTARFRGGARVPLAVADRREAAVVLDDTQGTARLGAVDAAAIVLRVRRPVWQLHAEVQIQHNDAEINGKPAARGTHPVVPGATSFRVGEWRLTWE
jgi:hypothetical protein